MSKIVLLPIVLGVSLSIIGCGGGHASVPVSPSKFASKAESTGCKSTSASGGEYVECDDETYIVVPDGSGSYIECDKAGSSKCQKRADAIAH